MEKDEGKGAENMSEHKTDWDRLIKDMEKCYNNYEAKPRVARDDLVAYRDAIKIFKTRKKTFIEIEEAVATMRRIEQKYASWYQRHMLKVVFMIFLVCLVFLIIIEL